MRVLVVEDERPLAAALQRGLANHGFAVETASDGLSGYLLARDEHFDAVVLDIMLPECNGFQVCERLRADDVQTPILMLTAMDDELDEAEALDLGADDFLRKPFSYLVLVARLHALLRRPEQRPTVLRSGPLTLDPGRRSARHESTELDLTPREFSLLEYCCAAWAIRGQSGRSSSMSGAESSNATPTSSRSTSGTCVERSTSRSGHS